MLASCAVYTISYKSLKLDNSFSTFHALAFSLYSALSCELVMLLCYVLRHELNVNDNNSR